MLQKIRKGIQIFLSQPVLFLAIIMTCALPGTVFTVLQRLFYQDQFFNPYLIVNAVIGIFIISIGSYTSVRLAQGYEVKYFEAIWEGSRKWSKILVTYFIYYIALYIGTILLVIPGIIVAVRFAQVPMVVLFEETSLKRTFTRSMNLTKGYGMQILGLIILVLLLIMPLAIKVVKLTVPAVPVDNLSVLFTFIAYYFANTFINGLIMQLSINVLSIYYLHALQRESEKNDKQADSSLV